MNKAAALRALRTANEVLGALRVRYWLDCGSLLGAVRHSGIMDHDLDVDFSCKDWQRHREIEEAMIAAGFEMFMVHGTPEHGYEQRFNLDGVKVDIFYFYPGTVRYGGQVEDPGLTWQGSYDIDKATGTFTRLIVSEFPSDLVAWTTLLTFQGITVPVPIEFEAMLVARYDDWTIEVPKWNYREDPNCITPETHPVGNKEPMLGDVTFLLKSFMRPEITLRAVRSIRATYDGVQILVVDDSDIPADFATDLEALGARLIRLPYDSGLSAGRNAGLKEITTRYVVVMDDDMVVSEATRLPDMLKLLEHGDIVCGTMTQNGAIVRWEGTYDLTQDGGLRLVQYAGPYQKHGRIRWAPVEFGLNCLVSTADFLRAHPWDEDLKIHEHTDFFLRLRGKGRVVFAPDCIFEHLRQRDPDYLRMRSRKEFRLLFFAKHGFKYHIGVSGRRDVWTSKDQVALERHLRTSTDSEGRPSVALEIERFVSKNKKKGTFIVQHRTFLDARGKATRRVRDAVRLFAIPGQSITVAEAREVGLLQDGQLPPTPPPTTTSAPATRAEIAALAWAGSAEVPEPLNLNRANLAQLQAEADARGLDASGTKKEIRERIIEAIPAGV